MEKHQEQVLLRDLGAAGDTLYYASAYANVGPSDWRYVGPGDYTLAYALYFKGMGLRASSVVIPNTLGYQIFDSTTNPIPRFNNCRNQKLRLVSHALGNWSWYRTFPTYETCAGSFYYRYKIPTGTTVPEVPELVDWKLSSSASSRAWWSMQPRFQGDFDGLNFLFELKDFKNIAKHIAALRPSKIEESLRKAKNAILRAERAVRNGSATKRAIITASAATRLASEAILIKHFAIDPTVKDLMALHGQLQNLVNDVQHRFRDKGLTTNRRHYSEDIAESESTTVKADPNAWYKVGTKYEDRFTATMEFTYDYKLRGQFDALKRYYGGELNAAVVWNAIPFSFLLDYFIKVGDAIENMMTDPNVVLEMSQYCESRLISKKHGMMWNGSCGRKSSWCAIVNGAPPLDNQMLSGYEGTLYERRVVPPRKGMALPRLKLPSTKQALNIVALARCMWG